MSEKLKSVSYRYDLDGLRGIAIAFVVIFHVFVGKVSGGVDVFLLLSGYFFLGSQLRYADRDDASLNPWWPVWRTIRRLIPTMVTVLTATVLVIAIWVPTLRTIDIANQVMASLLYFQNWELASQSADYGAASDETSPLQHLWSMAVQGQFYLMAVLFSLGIALAIRLSKRKVSATQIAGPVLIVVTIASFIYAVNLERTNQAMNYYSTWSRMWELSLGALLVIYGSRISLARRLRAFLAFVGLAMVVTTGLLFDGALQLPGPAALYPLAGAVFVILGGGPISMLLASSFFRWLGNIAYALYMWHWPALILATILFNYYEPPVWLGFSVIGVSLLLAHFTHKWIEVPLRHQGKRPVAGEKRAQKVRAALRRGGHVRNRAAAGVVVCALGVSLLAVPPIWRASVNSLLVHDLEDTDYPGAAVLAGINAPDVPYKPDPYLLADTVSPAWKKGCMSVFGDDPTELAVDRYPEDYCTFGDKDGDIEVYLLGGSHAEQWMAPLNKLGKRYGFRVIPLVRQACPSFATELDGVFSPQCQAFNKAALERVDKVRPDLVISNSTRPLLEKGITIDQVPASYPTLWSFLNDRDIPFLGLRDNPWFLKPDGKGQKVSQCVDKKGRVPECGRPRDTIYAPEDPSAPYLERFPNMRTIDTADWFCPDGFCGAVMGNIYMYRDGNHMSDEFALTLAPFIWQQLGPMVDHARRDKPAEPKPRTTPTSSATSSSVVSSSSSVSSATSSSSEVESTTTWSDPWEMVRRGQETQEPVDTWYYQGY